MTTPNSLRSCGLPNRPMALISLLSLLLSLIIIPNVYCGISKRDQKLDSYRVGVFEYNVTLIPEVQSREQALEAIKINIEAYNETAILARSKGVKLLVFPESGISRGPWSRMQIGVLAETIPHPKSKPVFPCEDAVFKSDSKAVQRWLSCIARDNEIYLVANMLGRETCDNEPNCPSDGQYLYNTNVVFSPKGQLVARYYKTHLFGEDSLDPAEPEAAIFDTPFGKFATFICFDIVFKKPTIDLIEKYNIRNIAYPTAWVKIPPFFRSIQTHQGIARGSRINLLAANLHMPQSTSYGSGIYTPTGPKEYYYRPRVPGSKLIVADIHPINEVKPDTTDETRVDDPKETNITNEAVINPGEPLPFIFKSLKNHSGSETVCHKSFCCNASYNASTVKFQEMYSLGAFNGYMDIAKNKIYIQVCTILKCPQNICGMEITGASTAFSNITLQGHGFSSKYVYPSVLEMDGDLYELAPDAWNYTSEKGIQTRPGKSVTLHSASLIGRVYSRDILLKVEPRVKPEVKQANQNNSATTPVTGSVIYVLYLAFAYLFATF